MIIVPRKKILLPTAAHFLDGSRHHIPRGQAALSAKVIITGAESNVAIYQGDDIAAFQKRNSKTKIPRITTVTMEFAAPTHVTATKVTRPGSSIHLYSGDELITPLKSVVTISHERAKGRQKILARFFLSDEIPVIDVGYYLSRFSRIIGVDTNTVEIGGNDKLSATAMVDCFPDNRGAQTIFRITQLRARTQRNLEGNPERFGWYAAITTLLKEVEIDHAKKYLLIVDSDLGLLESIQDKASVVWGDYLLPANIEIAFATCDSGSEEFLPCSLIRLADGFATRELSKR